MADKSSYFIKLENEYVSPNYAPLNVVIERGEGVWVYDVDGNKYMDLLAAYSALNQGYVHPKIFKAFVEQASKVTLTSRAFRNDKLPEFARKITSLLGYDMVLPMNSGAEAVETALKAARKWAYIKKGVPENKARIITASNNFHGRTISIVSFSTEEDYKAGFGPYTPGFDIVPYGDAEAIEKVITPNTAAVLLEPIQGEAGIIVPPEGYLRQVRDICDKHNILFVADEIQSGLGRTGKLLAVEWEEVKPDLVCLGKAISGGFYPVSAVVGTKEVLTVFSPGEHGSTYGGNPLGMAVAIAALDVLIEEKLPERALELGEYAISRLRQELEGNKLIKEIRGRGLWIGVELVPEAGGARKYCEKLMEKGLLVKDTHENTIRIAPPLVITKEELDWAIDRIIEVLV